MDIKGKAALVTGGASGIGFQHVKEQLKNGARGVAILDLASSKGEEATAKLEKEFGKGRAIFIPCDVTKAQELEAAFKKANEEFNGLDIVINNAGIMDEKRWELEININLTAVVRSTLLALDYMGKHKGGKGGIVVNMASVAGLETGVGFPVYCATKHAVVALSRCYAGYCEKTGVRVLAICPGKTDTALITKVSEKIDDLSDEGLDRILDLFPNQRNGFHPTERTDTALIKNVSDKLGESADKGIDKFMDLVPNQSPEFVAKSAAELIRNGKNGTVWIADNEEPIWDLSFPDYRSMKNVAR